MANKSIPILDKELVIQRLAEGQSTRRAIMGTAISSNQTAACLAKQQSHKITQLREEYIEAINKYASSRNYRAAMLADIYGPISLLMNQSIQHQTGICDLSPYSTQT